MQSTCTDCLLSNSCDNGQSYNYYYHKVVSTLKCTLYNREQYPMYIKYEFSELYTKLPV